MKINLLRAVFLLTLLISVISPAIAGATSTWTQVVSDSFNRSDSSTVGNSWNDESGNAVISSNTLVITNPATSTTGGPRVLRPSAEQSLDQRIDATFTITSGEIAVSGVGRQLLLRAHTDKTNDGSNLYSTYRANISNNGGTFQIVRTYNGLALYPNALSGSNASFTPTAGHSYTASFAVTNVFPAYVTLTLTDNNTSTVVASSSILDYAYEANVNPSLSSNGLNQTNAFMKPGLPGVGVYNSNISTGQTVSYTNVTTYNYVQSGSLVAPATLGTSGFLKSENSKYYLATQNPTGGTASTTSVNSPYYIRWYRGSGNFTPSLKVDGSGGGSGTFVGTGNEAVDSGAPSGISNFSIAYRAVFFDYASASTTGVLGPYINLNSPTTLKLRNRQYIGDSITYGYHTSSSGGVGSPSTSPGAFAETIIGSDSAVNTTYFGYYTVNGLIGHTSSDLATTDLAQIRSTAYDSQTSVASIMIGTNDSKDSVSTSNSQYKSNLQTIISALSNTATTSIKFVLNKPIWFDPSGSNLASGFSTSSLNRLPGYFSQLDQLADGSSIVVGSTSAYTEVQKYGYSASHTHIGSASYPSPGPVLGTSDYLIDGLHPYDGGAKMMATLEWEPNVKNAILGNYTAAYVPPDTTPPNATTTAPTSGSIVSGSLVTLSATSTDDVGVSGVKFYIDNTLIGSEDTSSPYSVIWDSTSVLDGTHSIVSVARDAAGNVATSTAVSFTVDNTAPSRSSGAPTGTLSLNTTSTNISLITDESATCKYSTSPGQLYASMTTFGSTASTTHSQTVSGLTNGTSYTYYVKCSDAYSNVNATDYAISFSIAADVTPPSVSITNPTSSSVVTGPSISLSANATDNVAVGGVKFYIGNASNVKTQIGSEDTTNPYSVTWDSTSVPDGAGYTAFAVARDTSGNIATSSSVSFSVDNTAPIRSAGSPSGTLAINTSTTTISLITDESATCKYSTSPGQLYASMTTLGTTGATNHSQVVSGLNNASSYTYYVKCSDAYSNVNATDYVISFNVASDITAPTVTLITPASNSILKGTVVLNANATDDVSVSGVKFYVDSTLIGSEDTSSPYSVNLDTTSILDGMHSIYAVARDSTGNISTSSATVVTIDNTAPIISSISSNTPSYSGVSITWNTDEPSNSTVYYGSNTSYGSSTQSSTLVQNHSINISGLTELSTYHFIVVSADAVGNQATSSDQTFSTPSSDVTPPVVSSGSPSSPQPSGTTSVLLSVVTDENAFCKYNRNVGVTYASVSNTDFTTTGTTTHSVVVTGLSDGNTYTYYVKCADSHLNIANDYTISFSISSPVVASSENAGGATGGGSTSGGEVSIIYNNRNVIPASTNNTNDLPKNVSNNTQTNTALGLPSQFVNISVIGEKMPEIKQLQVFLNTHGFPISSNGIGSRGKESTYFGVLTKLAIQRFQKANNISPANGVFGPKTKAFVNAILKKESSKK